MPNSLHVKTICLYFVCTFHRDRFILFIIMNGSTTVSDAYVTITDFWINVRRHVYLLCYVILKSRGGLSV